MNEVRIESTHMIVMHPRGSVEMDRVTIENETWQITWHNPIGDKHVSIEVTGTEKATNLAVEVARVLAVMAENDKALADFEAHDERARAGEPDSGYAMARRRVVDSPQA